MTAWKLNGKTLDYGPLSVDYVLISGVPRPKYIRNQVETSRNNSNAFAYKPDFPTYQMTWPRVSDQTPQHGGDEPLYDTLSELPLNKTITMTDGSYGIANINIQIINRKIEFVRTNPNREIINSITLTIRFLA